MIRRAKIILGLFAALLFASVAPVTHASAAMRQPMNGMSHGSAVTGNCLLACMTATGARRDDEPAEADADEDDETAVAPFYVAFRGAVAHAKQSLHERFVRKPPPKVPLYLQFVTLRP